MTFSLRHTNGSHRLLLLFGGWSAEHAWFDNCAPAGYDLITVCDYDNSTLEIQNSKLSEYSEICVVAWSFGVPVATRFIASHPELPFTTRIAINGTLTPVDDRTGIPAAIFRGTLDSLEAEAATVTDTTASRTLRKFDRRMCGCPATLLRTRSLPSLAAELRTLAVPSDNSKFKIQNSQLLWDLAVISDSDAIIPTANQLAAWEGRVPHLIIEGPHMPPFADLLHRLLIDKDLVARRFADSGSTTYSNAATAQRSIARKVASLIPLPLPAATPDLPHSPQIIQHSTFNIQNYSCLELGAGSGLLTRLYASQLPAGSELTLCDLSHISPDLPGRHIIADAEALIRDLPDASCDLVVASSVMQWFNSPLRFLTHVARVLRPGGTAVLSTFDPDNFPELLPFLPRPLLTPTPEAYSRHLASDNSTFNIQNSKLSFSVTPDTITLTFDSPRRLLAHLKDTGVNSLSADPAESARSARAIIRAGVTTLTYRPVYITLHRD